jgi:hypothetical protein
MSRRIDEMMSEGDAVLIVHRRLFSDDQSRFFIGTVQDYEAGIACVKGVTWLRDPANGEYCAKPDTRTKVISASSGTLMIYLLPAGCQTESLELAKRDDRHLVLRDGQGFEMDLSERIDA